MRSKPFNYLILSTRGDVGYNSSVAPLAGACTFNFQGDETLA